ncbi:MAG: hypothetical protein M3Y13_15410, partial [Armatimonadota bacterium]|nr:hypothetical protein [Armatimonadota bacterium]
LTATQAIARAKDFCQKIGHPVTVDGTAQFPVPKGLYAAKVHWQERWQVIFPEKTGQVEVDVVDATGVISEYDKEGLFHDNSPAGADISEADAIQIAAAALKATGHSEELKFDFISRQQSEYLVSWKRMGHGIAYRDEHATVGLNPETGEVSGLSLVFPSPPSTKTVGSVTRAQADAIAQNLLATEGLQDAVLDIVETKMVQPNTFWQAGGSVDPLPGEAQAVWAYRFQGAGTRFYEVWVDTQTGAIVGGETIGRKGGYRKPASRVKPSAHPAKATSR